MVGASVAVLNTACQRVRCSVIDILGHDERDSGIVYVGPCDQRLDEKETADAQRRQATDNPSNSGKLARVVEASLLWSLPKVAWLRIACS